jgi:3-hydroxyacyl-[acyl-carrier-protein] dehydratase
MNIDLATIFQILPHRPPFLFLDLVKDVEPLKRGTGVKRITADEEIAQGFFPETMAFPNILTLEMLAQTAAVVCGAALYYKNQQQENSSPAGAGFLVSADGRFDGQIAPGDTLEAHISIIKAWGRFVMAGGKVYSGEKLIAEGKFTLASA